jgi:hypothetical protein
MTKTSRFTKADIKNAAVIAREYGVTIKLEVDGSMVISPANTEMTAADELEADLDRELDAFKLKHGYS